MQKKLIALALAGMASGAAFAQSSVTIYGRVDYGFVSRNGDSGGAPERDGKSEFASGVQAGSRIGFKGAEDLGNGMKAIFELEYGITNDEDKGTGIGKNRHSYVGLTGNFGTVIGGRLDGVRYGIFNKYDAFAGGGVGNFTQMTGQVDRADNAVAYVTPTFAGFTGVLAYSSNVGTSNGAVAALGLTPGEHEGNRGDLRLNTAMVSYDNGPISINLDAERVYGHGFTGTLGTDFHLEEQVYTLAGSYDFGVVKLSALYDINKIKLEGDKVSDVRSWFVSAKAPIGSAVVLKATYGQTKDREVDDSKAKKWGIGADYKLSKRTNFFVDYGQIHNDDNSALEINFAPNSYGAGYGTRGFDLGIAHTF